jgi:signal transduction histidine kinase
MAFRKTMMLVALGASLVAAGAAFAGPEAGHPNIIAAREHAQMAIEKMKAAQAANEYDMGGHAAKAEKLLHEAEEQMRLAAEAANKHK